MSKKFLQANIVSSPTIVYKVLDEDGDNIIQAPLISESLPAIQNFEINNCSSQNNQNNSNTWEEDPIFTRSPSYNITQEEIDKWNNPTEGYNSWTLESNNKTLEISSKETLKVEGKNIKTDIIENTLLLEGEDSKYTGEATTGDVGGIGIGTIYEEKPVLELIDDLLHPFQKPSVFNFDLDLPSIIEVGINIPVQRLFTWNSINSKNINQNFGNIKELNSNFVIADPVNGANNGKSVTMIIMNQEPFSARYQLEYKDVKNQTQFSNITSLRSIFPMFIGAVDDLNPTEDVVKSLQKIVQIKGTQTYNYTFNSKRYCFAYPSFPSDSPDYGEIKSMKDGNNFEYFSTFTKTIGEYTINTLRQRYIIYTITKVCNATNDMWTFTF